MELCDGCGFLRFEDRPHGVKAARCGNKAPTGGAIQGFGRTLEVFNVGTVGPVVRPVWCTNGRERIVPTGQQPTSLRSSQ